MGIQKIRLTFLAVMFVGVLHAQFKLEAELRPRFELRHGFKTLHPKGAKPAAFISQRTRMNVGYKIKKFSFYLSLQDVRVWGDVPQLNTSDNSGLSVHQAWGEIMFDEKFSLKLGRQEIAYDDQRIMGSVGWAQQARSHDAALLRFNNEKIKFDLGFSFNQDAENVNGTTLTTPNTYKSIQYAWLHKDWQHFQASFLFLNNGMQFIDEIDSDNNETRFSQTIGTHLNYKLGTVGLISNLYYQFGKDVSNNNLSTYLLALEANYNPSQLWTLTLGTELQSGNDNGAPSNGDNNAFTPFYGTNHKFNGLMDYFYVGNHANNVGLVDTYINTTLKVNESSKLHMAFHNFAAAAELSASTSNQLGNEIDIVYSYRFDKDVIFKAGYSQLFPSEGMEILKNNFDENNNYFAWLMVVIKPNLLTF